MKKLALSLFIAPILALIFICVHVHFILSEPYQGEEKFFRIKSGEGFSKINYRLYKEKIISNPRVFHYYSKFTGAMTSFQTGTYEIKPGMDMYSIIDLFKNGGGVLYSLTIPEGRNIYEISELLLEKGVIKNAGEFIKAAQDKEIIKELDIGDAPSVEGYLYPETYKFAPDTPPKIIVKTMITYFKKVTQDLNLSFKGMSPHQIITLASIVEKETGAPFERRTIAGIYHNRLKKKMRLQADPTTIYGIYDRDGSFNGNLRKNDLFETTRYNTYKISGLPYGPICNPGMEAIKATLDPEEHNFLYFVSKNDGTHAFTSTYKEHNQAVSKWQRTRENRKGKSWRDLKEKK